MILADKQFNLRMIGLAALALSAVAVAGPMSISYTDDIPLQTTAWDLSVTIPRFDPALGELVGIDFTLGGHIEGSAAYESLDATPALISMMFQGEITLMRPDMSELVVVLPLLDITEPASGFDGVIDFDGTSGSTFEDLEADGMEMVSSPPPMSDLVLFTGLDDIVLPVTAVGMSSGSGSGNLLLQFMQEASAFVEVTYHYVPEPGTMVLLAGGALAVVRRRR